MPIKQVGTIFTAVLIALLAGLLVKTTQRSYDSCDVSALDAILDGGTLTLEADCVLMLDAERTVTGHVTITGGMLHGGGLQRILHVAPDANVTLRDVELRVGIAELVPQDGGGIYNEGTLTLIDSRMKGNRANRGGAIFNTGDLTLLRSQIDHNNARSDGGGIYNTGTLKISESIIAGNIATLNGNGIVNAGGIVDARNNYWGYPNGPRMGQVVGVDVAMYTPWLRTPPDWMNQLSDESQCSEQAIDAILAGGEVTLPARCLIFVPETKVITGNVVIRGAEYAGLSAVGQHRVLEVAQGASLRLENIIITGGFLEGSTSGGAGIFNRGNLTLIRSIITGNRTELASGAGIFNSGILTIEGSSIHHNFSDGGMGAGLFNMGQIRMADTAILHNTIYPRHDNSETPEFGAGIYNVFNSQMHIRNSYIRHNSAPNAGGIFNWGVMIVEDSDISLNETRAGLGCTGDGAGIFNSGDMTIRRSTINDNRAGKWAGGIDNQGVMVIEDSEIMRNVACVGGGAIFNAFETANLTITNSIIAENVSEERPERNNGLYNLVSLDFDMGTVQAINNYWGSSDRPGGEGPGSGDGISGVKRDTYTPWLENPPDWSGE